MKKILSAAGIFFLGFICNVSAKQIQVNVLNFSFSPKNFTATVGDTIHFVWVGGFHTTTSTKIPTGAASWDEPITSSNPSFLYPVKIAGDYAFQCSFHFSMGMVGSFSVQGAAAAGPWNLTGNNDAALSSRLGTNNAVPLRLFTNNLERLRIDTGGRIGIGISTPVNVLTVKSTAAGTPVNTWLDGLTSPVFVGFADNASSEFVLATASNTPVRRSVIQGRKSRGSLSAPAAVINNDYLTSLLASGYDGTTFQNPATIDFFVDGVPSAGNVPARISFVTGSSQANRTERLKVGSTGNFNFNNNQLFIKQSNGSIGVGTISPNAKVDVQDSLPLTGLRVNNSFAGNQNLVGIYSSSVNNPGWGYGIQAYGGSYGSYSVGQGGNFAGAVYGAYGQANGSAGSRYGVYGAAAGGTFNAAGYFNGDVWASAYNVISDRKFKTDISLIKSPVQKIMKLKPSTYVFKKEDAAKMGLPSGNQIGLIADEVKQVFPELVKDAVQPATYGKDVTEIIRPEIKYESVNYIGLIPVLVASAQEQQKQIELQQAQLQDQQRQIEELKEMIKQLTTANNIKTGLSNVILEQNIPNPLDKFTTIHYSIPAGSKNAQLIIADISGKMIKQVQLGSSAKGNVSFDATGLSNGSYTYSIIIDGKLIDTKKMLVAKTKDLK